MRLTGTVVKLESGRGAVDGLERVTIKLNESDKPMFDSFTVPNVDHLEMDDEVSLVVLVNVAARASHA